jgi:hypothetical protein
MTIHAACTTAPLRAEWRFQTWEFIELTRYEAASGFPFSIFEHPDLEIGMASFKGSRSLPFCMSRSARTVFQQKL